MTWNIGIYTYTCLLFYSIQDDLHPFSYMPPIFLSWFHYNSHSLFILLPPRVSSTLWCLAVDQCSPSWKRLCFARGIRPGSPSLTCASSGEHILKGLPLSLSLCISSFSPLLQSFSCPCWTWRAVHTLPRSWLVWCGLYGSQETAKSKANTLCPGWLLRTLRAEARKDYWDFGSSEKEICPPFPSLWGRGTHGKFGKRDLSRGPANDSHICPGKERLTSSFAPWWRKKIINRLKQELIDFKIRVPHLKLKFLMY